MPPCFEKLIYTLCHNNIVFQKDAELYPNIIVNLIEFINFCHTLHLCLTAQVVLK